MEIAGKKTPGLAKVRVEPEYATDAQRASGEDAAAIILSGYQPPRIEIEILVWTPEQWTKLDELQRGIWRQPNKAGPLENIGFTEDLRFVPTKPKQRDQAAAATQATVGGAQAIDDAAVTLVHPKLAQVGITAGALVGLVPAEDGPERGSKTVKLRFIQYIPRKPQPPVRKITKTAAGKRKGDLLDAVQTPGIANRPEVPSDSDAEP